MIPIMNYNCPDHSSGSIHCAWDMYYSTSLFQDMQEGLPRVITYTSQGRVNTCSGHARACVCVRVCIYVTLLAL